MLYVVAFKSLSRPFRSSMLKSTMPFHIKTACVSLPIMRCHTRGPHERHAQCTLIGQVRFL